MNKFKLSLLIISLALSLSLGYSTTTPKKVLLAYENTPFKAALIAKMKTLLESKKIVTTVVLHSDKIAIPHKTSEFNATFLSISGVNSTVRPWITKYIDENKADKAKIILHITKTRKWEVETGVDTISSASTIADVDQLATLYVEKIISIVTPTNTTVKTEKTKNK